jgi:hypothetical protein
MTSDSSMHPLAASECIVLFAYSHPSSLHLFYIYSPKIISNRVDVELPADLDEDKVGVLILAL